LNWPFQSSVTNSKWSTSDSTIAIMTTSSSSLDSSSKDASGAHIKHIVLDDIKKYFPLDVTVKTIKTSSSKILLHRSSKKIRTKTKLEYVFNSNVTYNYRPLKPELISPSTSLPAFPIPPKPAQRKPITIATSTATVRKPLDDLLSNVPRKLPKLETIPESPSPSLSSTSTTPREGTDSSVSVDVSPRSPNQVVSELVAMETSPTSTTVAKPARPPRPTSAAFTLVATSDMSSIVPVSAVDLDLFNSSNVTSNPVEM
jgi:hypothetical protein